jgi:ABC-type enterochelin transport system ATPase subunit
MIAMLRRRLMGNKKKMCTVTISGFSSLNWYFGRVSAVENSTQETSLTDGTYEFEQGTQLYCSMTSKQENYNASIKLDGKYVAIKSYPYPAKYTLVLNSDCTVVINYALALMEITTLGEKTYTELRRTRRQRQLCSTGRSCGQHWLCYICGTEPQPS